MIPDFPEAKKVIKKTIDIILQQRVKQNAPLLSMTNKKSLFEGDKLGVTHPDGRHIVNELQLVKSEFTVAHKDIPGMNVNDFMAKISTTAEDMAGQIERNLFKTINESIKESGNTIPGNPKLDPESILLALEKIQIDFEDDDRLKPIRPTLFAGPDAIKNLMESEAKRTPEEKEMFLKKEEEIMDKKYEEYIKDLNSRKIID